MSKILNLVRIDPSMPFLGRAAQRSMVGTLNFTISNLLTADIRKRMQGVPVDANGVDIDPLLQKYGNTLDRRNEQDEAARGEEHEQHMREEQGFEVGIPPIELAARLKIVRDWLADDLDEHAGLIRNTLDPRGGVIKNPYDVARSLEDSFAQQLVQQPRVNEVLLKAQADALGIPFEDALRVTKQRQEAGIRFMKANQKEILGMLQTLSASGPDGHALTTADAEDVEPALPAIHRARLYVAADRGLWYERDRAINMVLRGHPDGNGNVKLVNGKRVEIHAEFNRLMRIPDFKAEIGKAVERGAMWPTLIELPEVDKKAVAA